MKRFATITLLFGVAALAACGGKAPGERPSATEPSAATAKAEAEKAAAERRAEEQQKKAVGAARQELETLGHKVDGEASDLAKLAPTDRALRASVDDLRNLQTEARRAVDGLAAAGPDARQSAQAEVKTKLDSLRDRAGSLSDRLEGVKAVLDERRAEKPEQPVAGLFEGLDGGEYDAYRASVVSDVQTALRDQGYYRGPADGRLGKPTMDAIARFQKEHGLAQSGVPSPLTRAQLLGAGKSG